MLLYVPSHIARIMPADISTRLYLDSGVVDFAMSVQHWGIQGKVNAIPG
jgi:hypothetical protein